MDPTDIAHSNISTKIMEWLTNAIQSKDTTPEEQALGLYTRKKLKNLSKWDLWYQGEIKQINQFEDLQMFDKPVHINNGQNPRHMKTSLTM